MTAKSFSRFCQAALLVALACTAQAHADGKFFGRPLVEDPNMMAQRGLVAWRDGIETLIVQSDIEGGSDDLGWVVPLPARPTAIEACPTLALEYLAELAVPLVSYSSMDKVNWALLLLVVALLTLLAVVAPSRQGRFASGLAAILLPLAFVFFVPAGMGTQGQPVRQRIERLDLVAAGVYDIEVIRGDSADAVEEWLTSNGFSYSADLRPALDDYVAQRWCFAAAKVRRSAPGPMQHHPLRFTFPSSRAVYPMRLTGVGRKSLALDLFVIGAAEPVVAGLQPWVVRRFRPDQDDGRFAAQFQCTVPLNYRAEGYPYLRVGMPAIADLMWPGCFLTRLHGELASTNLTHDLILDWRPPQSGLEPLHSTVSAFHRAMAIVLAVLAIGVFVSALLIHKRGWNFKAVVRHVLRPALISGLLLGVGVRLSIPAVQVGSQDILLNQERLADAHDKILRSLSDTPPAGAFPDDYAAKVEATIASAQNRELWAKNLRNYTIVPDGAGWSLTIDDQDHVPVSILIDPAGRPVPRSRNAPTSKTEEIPTGGN